MSTPSPSIEGFYAYNETLKAVYYGPGSVKTALPKLLEKLGVKKAFIVTGKTLKNKTSVVQSVEDVLKQHNTYTTTFADIGEHAPIAGIKSGLSALKESGADVLVSVGGGSPIDGAKAMIYHLQKETNGPFLKHIAVPTVLSAAEFSVSFIAGLTNEKGEKTGVSTPELAPAGIILDAELTLATPEKLWLSTGIRALDHAVESLYRAGAPRPIKVLCLASIASLFKYLPESKADPKNVEVRQRLQIAAWMSLWPLQLDTYSPLGLSHVLGYRLGAKYGVPHGITSCLTLASVVALQAEVASAEDKEVLADALWHIKVPSTGSVDGDVLKLSEEIASLVTKLGLRTDLAAFNIPRSDVPKIAELTVGSTSNALYPKVVQLLDGLYGSSKL
ncbi:alcohol dehydrogenase IV [Rickenella mellea]|uniref:Alcohol dehydrogenase IV n=1 Tax=Rickenella mellea TaxID=50990 RepID=A0A4Y7QH31_9AGAM|nr:alcohol dehydrogenase IV [Rickenella mellea]